MKLELTIGKITTEYEGGKDKLEELCDVAEQAVYYQDTDYACVKVDGEVYIELEA